MWPDSIVLERRKIENQKTQINYFLFLFYRKFDLSININKHDTFLIKKNNVYFGLCNEFAFEVILQAIYYYENRLKYLAYIKACSLIIFKYFPDFQNRKKNQKKSGNSLQTNSLEPM